MLLWTLCGISIIHVFSWFFLQKDIWALIIIIQHIHVRERRHILSEENRKCSKTTAAGEQNLIFIFRGCTFNRKVRHQMTLTFMDFDLMSFVGYHICKGLGVARILKQNSTLHWTHNWTWTCMVMTQTSSCALSCMFSGLFTPAVLART